MRILVAFMMVLCMGVFSSRAGTKDSVDMVKKNGKTYIRHMVGKGETFAGIAARYKVNVAELRKENPAFKPDVRKGNLLFVPYIEPVFAPEPSMSEIFAIATKGSNDSVVPPPVTEPAPAQVEQPLVASEAQPEPVSKDPKGSIVRTEVKGGKKTIIYSAAETDNLADLASYYGTTPQEIMNRNNLKSTTLKKGQIIKIPVGTGNTVKVEQVLQPPKKEPVKAVAKAQAKPKPKDGTRQIGDLMVQFKGNKRFILHTVLSGEDLPYVAKKFMTTQSKISSTNDLRTSKLRAGQKLKVPTTDEILKKLTGIDPNAGEAEQAEQAAVVAQNTDAAGQRGTGKYADGARFTWGDVVYPNDSATVDSLRKVAGEKSNDVGIGELHANANSGETKENYSHVVMAGETIESIAKKYSISASDIANWNDLYQNRVRVGQELIVNYKRARKPYFAINSLTSEQKQSISNNDKSDLVNKVTEKGIALLQEDNKYKGILHRTAPVGTLLLLQNAENFKKMYVRVTGTLSHDNPNVILRIDEETARVLGINNPNTNVILQYGIVEQ